MTRSPKLPDWVASSSPGHNRPLVPRVERIAREFRRVADAIQTSLDLPFESLYRPERPGLGFTLEASDVPRRSAWAVLGEWLVATAVQASPVALDLATAHEWFWQGSERRLGTIPSVPVAAGVNDPAELRALMPYLLDPMAAATRRDVISALSTAHERNSRKAAGVYYTPGDVAHLMIQRVMGSRHSHKELWLDPACGSGVFLRATLAAIHHEPNARRRIYGVDLDPFAAEAAAFVLAAEDLILSPDGPPPWRRWHDFRRNIATGDSLLIDVGLTTQQGVLALDLAGGPADGRPLGSHEPWRLSEVFPETARLGFTRIVANPPYAPLRRGAASVHVADLHPVTGTTANQDISPVFVELSTRLLPEDGSLSIVLPLSVVASSRAPFPALRRYLAEQPGSLELLSFDRVPDALFGDDIKTRNAVVHLDKSADRALMVSPLYRWTSRTRRTALAKVPVTTAAGLGGVPNVIPKIGHEWERELLIACDAHRMFLRDWANERRQLPLTGVPQSSGDSKSDVIAVAPTAYNFLGIVRDPHRAVTDGHDSQNSFTVLRFDTEQKASAAYAILCSRLAFWLWHVTGDGFHVTGSIMNRVPVPSLEGPRAEDLAKLGDRLWKVAIENPVISTNRGRTTVAYPTWAHSDLIDRVDEELGDLVGIDFRERLSAWHDQLVVVDHESERRNLIRRKTQ